MKLSLVIPCYNEELNISQMHQQLEHLGPELEKRGPYEIIFVDDGSSDSTYSILQNMFESWPQVRIVQHPFNQGLGQALRTGLAQSKGEVVVCTDSDGTYPFTTIPEMLDLLVPGIDIVTASPYHPGGGIDGVPPYRIILSKGASLLYRIFVDPRIHTYTAMYRAYRRPVIENIPTQSNGFLMVTELLVGAVLEGYKVAEYPTTLRVRRYGQSKARLFSITLSHLRYQAKIIARRIRSIGRPARKTT
jgi:dolichol-phosphate mannosyltransferase